MKKLLLAIGQLRELRFDRLFVKNGLPANYATCVLQDKRGYIWFGFEYATKKFLPFFNAGGDRASITDVFEAPSEPRILWLSVASNNKQSFVRFDTKNKAVKIYRHQSANPNSLHCDTVVTLFEDKAKRLWLGTTNGLSLFDRKTETFTAYLPQDTLTDWPAAKSYDGVQTLDFQAHPGEIRVPSKKKFDSTFSSELPSNQN